MTMKPMLFPLEQGLMAKEQVELQTAELGLEDAEKETVSGREQRHGWESVLECGLSEEQI